MKYLLSFIGTLAIISFQSIAVSAFFTLCKLLLSLLGICDTPTWYHFLGGSAMLFAVLFIYSVSKTAITMYRYHKDPIFKDANISTGIGCGDYKRLRNSK